MPVFTCLYLSKITASVLTSYPNKDNLKSFKQDLAYFVHTPILKKMD